MFCTNCGMRNADYAKFCTNCGAALKSEEFAGVHGSTCSEQPLSSTPAKGGDPERPKRRRSKAKFAALTVIAAVTVVAVAAAAVLTRGFGLLGPKSIEPKATVNDYSWDELSQISTEISTASSEEEALELARSYHLTTEDGTLDGTQVKQIQLADGTTTEVQIAGFYHDDKSDGSGKAGITFIFRDAIAQHAMNSSGQTTGGWEACEMRAWMNGELISQLPEDLQSHIVTVDKLTNNSGQTADPTSVTTTPDKLWLFSNVEIAGMPDESMPAYYAAIELEGSQYKLFSDCLVDRTSTNMLLAKSDARSGGTALVVWGLRTPSPDNSANFGVVLEDQIPNAGARAAEPQYVVPGFCL